MLIISAQIVISNEIVCAMLNFSLKIKSESMNAENIPIDDVVTE